MNQFNWIKLEYFAAVAGLAGVVFVALSAYWRYRYRSSRARLLDGVTSGDNAERKSIWSWPSAPTSQPDDPAEGFLRRWLQLAGFRWRGAVAAFLSSTFVCLVVGAGTAFAISSSGLVESGLVWLEGVPGGLGAAFAPLLVASPWILFTLIGFVPWLVVRSARRERLREVENDLPMTLELLATLAEAGLGFDAALARIVDSWPLGRHLANELRTFQLEVLAGFSRTQCFRRLARRLEVGGIRLFASALIQAEQVGSGIAEVLRVQSDDLRQRRRERAIREAETLQVKLVFPLVICCLPGLFVITLGPAFSELFEVLEGVIQSNVGSR